MYDKVKRQKIEMVLAIIGGTLRTSDRDAWLVTTIIVDIEDNGAMYALVRPAKDYSQEVRKHVVSELEAEGYEVDVKWI